MASRPRPTTAGADIGRRTSAHIQRLVRASFALDAGIEIIRNLRGFTTGFAVPRYVLDTPYGKVPMARQYMVDRDDDAVYLQNFEGKVWREPNPRDPNAPEYGIA